MLTFNHVALFPSVIMHLFHCPDDGQLLEHILWHHCERVSFEQPLRAAVACKYFIFKTCVVVWDTDGLLVNAD
jgi:hypothetical protein